MQSTKRGNICRVLTEPQQFHFNANIIWSIIVHATKNLTFLSTNIYYLLSPSKHTTIKVQVIFGAWALESIVAPKREPIKCTITTNSLLVTVVSTLMSLHNKIEELKLHYKERRCFSRRRILFIVFFYCTRLSCITNCTHPSPTEKLVSAKWRRLTHRGSEKRRLLLVVLSMEHRL
jgi:hypothetical protein